ncbi:MAG TPA: restriction endonuclease subunit S [Comamonadaceae bacterium]|nr:restriction endonuclease subunit S [Comamonadaceae bacterium]
MSSEAEWKQLTLKAAGVALIDCDHRTPAAADEGIPYIAIPQLRDGHIVLDGVRRISEADYIEWTKKLSPQADDVIVVRRCNSGERAHVPTNLKCAIGQNLVVLRSDGSKVLPQYLRWLVRGVEWWSEVGKYINVGAVFDSLRCRDIPNFELPVPPLDQQREIATILASIDDRITLLRETNATLEAIAQALFKSWFVDFDPVRAKMEGRTPEGMDEATAALFPDGFETSELGEVPRGWRQQTFRDTIQIIGGGTPKTSNPEFWGGDIPWFSVVDAPGPSNVFVIDTEKHITDAGLHGSSTKLLPIGTTIISARGTVGKLALTGRAMAMNQACYGLRGKAGDTYFTYFSSTRLVQQLQQRAHGSVFDTITQETFAGVHVAYPQHPVIEAFDVTVSPLMARIRENLFQAQTLSTLRDTLLPRLISGQLRLPDVQAAAEAALGGALQA